MPNSRNVSDLHPYFAPIVREVLRRAEAGGEIYPFVTSTRRPHALQACYFAQGRLQPGHSATYQGLTVTTARHGDHVVARCRGEEIRVPIAGWSRRVTNAPPHDSWHTLGFAVDFAFRSAKNARDARYDAALFRKLAAIFRAVCSDVRWGNDWDGDGVETASDQDERSSDMPHFEWHPGVTIREVASGNLPLYPKQCHVCGSFCDKFAGETCAACAAPGRTTTDR